MGVSVGVGGASVGVGAGVSVGGTAVGGHVAVGKGVQVAVGAGGRVAVGVGVTTLTLAAELADRVGTMYAGMLVEVANVMDTY